MRKKSSMYYKRTRITSFYSIYLYLYLSVSVSASSASVKTLIFFLIYTAYNLYLSIYLCEYLECKVSK